MATIKFIRDERSGDYTAKEGGVQFTIYKSTDAGFGLSAYRQSDRKSLTSNRILWLGSKKNCVERAEEILRTEQAQEGGSE